MTSIKAAELKALGVASIEAALGKDPVAVICDDEGSKFVVMTSEHYKHLSECALLVALADSKADLASGRFSVMTAEEHVAKITS